MSGSGYSESIPALRPFLHQCSEFAEASAVARPVPGCFGVSWPHSSTSSSHAGMRPISYGVQSGACTWRGPRRQPSCPSAWTQMPGHTEQSGEFFLRIPPLHTGLATLCGNSTSIQAQPRLSLQEVTRETPGARPKESLLRQAGLFQAQGIPAILNAIRSAADTRHNRHNLSLHDCENQLSSHDIAA